jgi:hypothetical protein
MGLVDILKNPKNIIPEVTMSIGADGFAFGSILISNYFNFSESESSVFIPFMKSSGALIGKIGGYVFCHRELIEEDFEKIKSDLSKISKIMVPYQILNYCVQSATLYGLQKSELVNTDDTLNTMGVIIGVDAVCSVGRYFFEHKYGIIK